ncbi:DUF982 domain-containing protein [Phyllobacterium sp. OV277]|uniref:DUF982 domain-containing protein n=1 Tax=Phyllobacterium sp. OV277 TaxID=1882772 RepID=UPI0008843641|nr:DUF982 domain-containing protein [Phyllobacterium sp. OV277]SDP36939.1 Protein of unknown function [Phyllobacterium sp. OV277]
MFEHVSVKSPRTGRILVVRDVHAALTLLTEQWSKNRTEKHAAACEACRSAIAGTISNPKARIAFVEAAQEVHILVEERTGPQMIAQAIEHKISSHEPNKQP